MVELVCLACGRTNPSDARFCSQCGAALLRRFCDQCHAVNDAEAHFCRACGAGLPAQLLPATSAPAHGEEQDEEEESRGARTRQPRSVHIPTLTEFMPGDEARTATVPSTLPPLQEPAPSRSAEIPALQALRPAHRTALLAVAGLVVLLVVAALWSRAPRTDALPHKADTASTRGAGASDAPAPQPAPPVPSAPASTTGRSTDSSGPVESAAPDAGGESRTAEPAPEAQPAPADAVRRGAPSRDVAAEPRRPTTAPRPARAPATPAPAPSPTPAPECTRQLDALGLCAPGATITGR